MACPQARSLWVKWPPPSALTNRLAPRVIAALLLPVVLIVWKHNLRKASGREEAWQREELERKRAKLATIVAQVRKILAAMEQERAKTQEPGGPGGDQNGKAGGSSINNVLMKMMGATRWPEDFKIRFIDLWLTVREVQALDSNNELLGTGLDLAAQILSIELASVSARTLKGTDKQYANGEQLKERLEFAYWLRQSIQRTRGDLTAEERAVVDKHSSELLRKYVAGKVILGKLRQLDMFSAIRLIAEAKREVLLLLLASSMSAVSGMLDALDVLYRAESLEMLREPAFEWSGLRAKVRAFLSIRAVRIALQVLIQSVHNVGKDSMEHKMRTRLYASLMHQDFEWYRLGQTDQRDVERIFHRMFQIPENVAGVTSAFTAMIEQGASATGQVVIIKSKSSRMLRTMLAMELSASLLKKGLDATAAYLKWTIDDGQGQVEVQWHEPMQPSYLPTARSCTAEARTLTNWEMFWQHNMRKESRKQFVDMVLQPLHFLTNQLTPLATYFFAGQFVKAGEVSVLDLQFIQEMSSNVANHATTLVSTWSKARDNYEPLARSWEVISSQPAIGLSGGRTPSGRALGCLAFDQVYFRYEEGQQVIQGLSFDIKAGTTCAITGTSGAGKSTIFMLLERFYDPKAGQVRLDGVDLRELNPVWVRKQMSIVEQHPKIFSLSLRDNLIFGCEEDPSAGQIEDACCAAGIRDFVFGNQEKFPAGLYTRISQHTLSGGELQRVAIARALLADKPILLLDEATSALDSHTQADMKDALASLMKGRTVVMIAHRLETIKEADQILVLSQGKLVEQGSHEELVAKKGHYADLYKRQVTATIVADDGSSASSTENAGPPGSDSTLSV